MNSKKSGNKTVSLVVKEKSELLVFLCAEARGKSRNNLKSALARGDVSVNGRRVKKFDFPLKPNDTVVIGENKPDFFQINPALEIVFEDDDFLVISKPCDLLSIATDKESEATAYHYVTEYVKLKNKNSRIFIVHRLDRDTSGIILFAKTPEIKTALQENWNELVKYRGYTALVEGKVAIKEDTITSYLRKTETFFVYSARDTSGDKAITNYKVIAQNEKYSLMDISIDTGRKNQIRVHMKEMGHPVAGDKKYGAETNPIKRLCLHAGRLTFMHPITEQEFDFKVDYPRNFASQINGRGF